MCGIAGIFKRNSVAVDAGVLDRLEQALHHRGPDSVGRFVRGPIAFVHTRLAIIDLESGQQPIHGQKGATLIANAEIYNAPEIKAGLVGHHFETNSDCEPPVQLFEEIGVDYVTSLRGMYAIAICSKDQDRIQISRDQFGIKPLYYVENDEGFAFASEPQALVAAGLVTGAITTTRRDELLQLKFTVGADTIFEGIKRVLPGETLIVEDGRIVSRSRIPAVSPPKPAPAVRSATESELLARFEAVMVDSVAAHLQSDVPVGLFLSGGIDSSILLLLIKRIAHERILSITVGYDDDQHHSSVDETTAAQAFAKRHDVECERIHMGPEDFWTLGPRIASAIDDPTADAAVLPTFMLGMAAAKLGRKVILCGEGADELFGGYRRYRPRLFGRFRRDRSLRRGVLTKTSAGAGLDDHWKTELANVIAGERSRWGSTVEAAQAIDMAEWLPNDLLVKLDRCLMVHGIEGRTPYLDREVAAFAAQVPLSSRIQGDLGKVLMRRWLGAADPAYPAFAKKKGFNVPVGQWIADRAPVLSDLVARQQCMQTWITRSAVDEIFANAGKESQPAWSLLFYALWYGHHVLKVDPNQPMDEFLRTALDQ